MVAKVTPLGKEGFFLENTVITRLRGLPLPTLLGVGAKWDMKENIPVLILPASTRIEPCTDKQMEEELRARQKPSRREK